MQLFQAVQILAVFPVGLNHNLVNLSAEVYVVDVAGAEVVLQNIIDAADAYLHGFGFFAVNRDIIVRRLSGIGRVGIGNVRILIEFGQETF